MHTSIEPLRLVVSEISFENRSRATKMNSDNMDYPKNTYLDGVAAFADGMFKLELFSWDVPFADFVDDPDPEFQYAGDATLQELFPVDYATAAATWPTIAPCVYCF